MRFDKYFRSDRNFTAIFYADVYSSEYLAFYSALLDKCKEFRNLNFSLRYKPRKGRSTAMYLSGYGVELAVKSTEYKAIDDREHFSNSDIKSDEIQENRLPDLSEEFPSIKKLTKNQISSNIFDLVDISLKALSIASAAEKISRFSKLVALSEDFPKVAHLLDSKEADKSVAMISINLLQSGLIAGNGFFLNGLHYSENFSGHQ
jgi:UDP-glucose:glycoprotein glucosyltransferase